MYRIIDLRTFVQKDDGTAIAVPLYSLHLSIDIAGATQVIKIFIPLPFCKNNKNPGRLDLLNLKNSFCTAS